MATKLIMVEKELRQIQYKTNALTFQNELCFKKTKALRVSSPKCDLSFILKLPKASLCFYRGYWNTK